MIPIKYTGDLSFYNDFIGELKENLARWLKCGYVGNRGSFQKDKILKYHDSLPDDSKELYLKAVDKGFADRASLEKAEFNKKAEFKKEESINAPKRMLSPDGLKLLGRLQPYLDQIADARPDELVKIIKDLNLDFSTEKSRKTDLYEDLYSVFVKQGYVKLDKDAIWRATNVRVCPYCNRTYVGTVKTEKKKDNRNKTVKGQLDHFYPKELYPYLAVSRYNLVPSCSYCNGADGKGNKDAYKEGLVNPYALTDHNGMSFKLKEAPDLSLDLTRLKREVEILVDSSQNSALDTNCDTFNLVPLYNSHRDIAAEIVFKHRAVSSKKYVDFVQGIVNDASLHIDMKDFLLLYWGVPLSDQQLGDRPLSKFIKDLLNDLSKYPKK